MLLEQRRKLVPQVEQFGILVRRRKGGASAAGD